MEIDMRSFSARSLRWLLPAVLVSAMSTGASADLIISLDATATPAGGGLTRYEYAVTNEATSTLAFIQFQLATSPGANPGMITGPDGWDISFDDVFSVLSWTSFVPATDIFPGHSATFSFVSPLPPGDQEYSAAGFDDATGEGQVLYGITTGPTTTTAAVPEPSSLVSLALGVATYGVAFGLRRIFRRDRSRRNPI